MRILHTADWHLGKKLNRVDRSGDLRRSVEAIFGYCESESVDVLLIAGDLFDTVSRYDENCASIEHLKETARPFLSRGGTILATTGNHDRETFCKTLQYALALADPSLAKPGDRLATGRFHLLTRPAFHRIADRSGPDVQFVVMPYPTASRYLDDATAPHFGGGDGKNRFLREAFAETLGRMRKHPAFDAGLHSVLVAHLFLQGATLPNGHVITSDHEKIDIVCPPEDLGAGWAYVALGHVHKPQMLGGRPNVRYSGSIERLDFGERDDETGVLLLDIAADGLRSEPRWLPLEASTFLEVIVSDPPVDLPALEAAHPVASPALVRCHVTYRQGQDDPDEIVRRLDALFPRCYSRTIVPAGRDSEVDAPGDLGATGRSMRDVVLDYVKSRIMAEPNSADALAEAESLLEEVAS